MMRNHQHEVGSSINKKIESIRNRPTIDCKLCFDLVNVGALDAAMGQQSDSDMDAQMM
jgi:hypothetical protein